MAARFSSLDSYETVEMEMGMLVFTYVDFEAPHVATMINGRSSQDIVYLLVETFLFTWTYQTILYQLTQLFV
jgi:hypothetical protein